jgi:hypothetical protein
MAWTSLEEEQHPSYMLSEFTDLHFYLEVPGSKHKYTKSWMDG